MVPHSHGANVSSGPLFHIYVSNSSNVCVGGCGRGNWGGGGGRVVPPAQLFPGSPGFSPALWEQSSQQQKGSRYTPWAGTAETGNSLQKGFLTWAPERLPGRGIELTPWKQRVCGCVLVCISPPGWSSMASPNLAQGVKERKWLRYSDPKYSRSGFQKLQSKALCKKSNDSGATTATGLEPTRNLLPSSRRQESLFLQLVFSFAERDTS